MMALGERRERSIRISDETANVISSWCSWHAHRNDERSCLNQAQNMLPYKTINVKKSKHTKYKSRKSLNALRHSYLELERC